MNAILLAVLNSPWSPVILIMLIFVAAAAAFSPREEPANRLKEFGEVLVDLFRGRRS